MISGFHFKVDEHCAFLGYYAVSGGNSVNIHNQIIVYATSIHTDLDFS